MLNLTLSTGPIWINCKQIVAIIPEATETLILTTPGVIYYVKETTDQIAAMNAWSRP